MPGRPATLAAFLLAAVLAGGAGASGCRAQSGQGGSAASGGYIERLPGVTVGHASARQRLENSAAITRALSGGATLHLRSGTTIELGRSIVVPSGGGIVGDSGGAKPILAMPASAFSNRDNGASGRYGPTAVAINFSGANGVRLENFAIRSDRSQGRYLRGIAARNVRDCTIRNVEISGIPTGIGIALSSATGCQISGAYIHDFADSTAWPTLPQSTGIEIDNDLVGRRASSGITIDYFRIVNIVVSGPFLAKWGYQTDGINVANKRAHVVIRDGVISNVGEGIDTFGSDGVISNVVIKDSYLFGLKFIHGASRNRVDHVSIDGAGIAGVTFAGSYSAHQDTADNVLTDITIRNIDQDGVWFCHSTAGISVIDNQGTAGKPRDNLVEGAQVDVGPNGHYGWIDLSTGSNNGGRDITIRRGAAFKRPVLVTGKGAAPIETAVTGQSTVPADQAVRPRESCGPHSG